MAFNFGSFGTTSNQTTPLWPSSNNNTTTTPQTSTPFTLFGNTGNKSTSTTTTTPVTPLFGTPNNNQQIPLFGQNQAQTPQIPLFGQNPPQTQTQQPSIFGQPLQQQTQQPSIFGQPKQQQTQQPSIFGQPQQQQQTPLGQQLPQQTSIFGQPQQQPTFNFGLQPPQQFGQQPLQQSPQFGNFGQQPLSGFGQPSVQPQMQIPLQRLPTMDDFAQMFQYASQLEAHVKSMQSQQVPVPPVQVPGPFPQFPNNTVTIPAFLENGSPIVMQIPMGRASSFALMQGFRPVSTPQGIQFYPSENYPHYRDSSGTWLGYEKGSHRLGRSPSSHSLYASRSHHSLPPSRQQGSTCIADPFWDRPHFLRPSTAPVLSSPSSTSIFFDENRNPDLKSRTLSWRKGYAGYPYGYGSREADMISRNYEAIVNNDMFGKKNKDKIYPTMRSMRDWKWKQLDEDVLRRCGREDILHPSPRTAELSSRPKRTGGVTFFDQFDPNYFATTPDRRKGPPKSSHLDDEDRQFHDVLWSSSTRKGPEVVGNLPGRFEGTPRGILKNGVNTKEERTSPIFLPSYKYVDASRTTTSSTCTQTPCSNCMTEHAWLSPVHGTHCRRPSGEVIEVFRASNRPPVSRDPKLKYLFADSPKRRTDWRDTLHR